MDEGQLVGIAHVGNQRQREDDHRLAIVTQGLEGIGRAAPAVVDGDLERATTVRPLGAAVALDLGFDGLDHLGELPGRGLGAKALGRLGITLLRRADGRQVAPRQKQGGGKGREGSQQICETGSEHHVQGRIRKCQTCI